MVFPKDHLYLSPGLMTLGASCFFIACQQSRFILVILVTDINLEQYSFSLTTLCDNKNCVITKVINVDLFLDPGLGLAPPKHEEWRSFNLELMKLIYL